MAAPNNEEIYVNVLTFASGQDGHPVPLIFNETRSTPFLTNARAFKLAIMRFQVTYPQLPVWIPLIDSSAPSPNDTVYYVGFAIAPCDDQQRVQAGEPIAGASVRVRWSPENTKFGIPQWPPLPGNSYLADDDSSRYYWATSVQKVLDTFNEAFEIAWLNAVANAKQWLQDNWTGSDIPAVYVDPTADNNIIFLGSLADGSPDYTDSPTVSIQLVPGSYSFEAFANMVTEQFLSVRGSLITSNGVDIFEVVVITAELVSLGSVGSYNLNIVYTLQLVSDPTSTTADRAHLYFDYNGLSCLTYPLAPIPLITTVDPTNRVTEGSITTNAPITAAITTQGVCAWASTSDLIPPAPKIVRTGSSYSLAFDPWPFFPQIAPSYAFENKRWNSHKTSPQAYVILSEAASTFLSGLPTYVDSTLVDSSSLLQNPNSSGVTYWALADNLAEGEFVPSEWDNTPVHIVNIDFQTCTNVVPPISASSGQVNLIPHTGPVISDYTPQPSDSSTSDFFPRLYPPVTTTFSRPVVYVQNYSNPSGDLVDSQYAYAANTAGYAYFPFERDPSDNWSPVESIAFATPTLLAAPEINSTPSIVNDDNNAAPSTSAAFANTFTDISLPLTGGAVDWQGKILYTPSGEFRRIDLTAAQPITVISFIVYWRCIINNALYTLRVAPGGSASLKLLFEKRLLARQG